MCSFCIIPFARGRVRSRMMGNLLEEARMFAARGVKEIVLTGVNVGTYRHAGQTIVDVIERLNDIAGVRRIRISSIEPTTIPEALFPLMQDPDHALVPFLHIPLQSGSNRILEAMRRQYTREEYLEFLRLACERVPDIGLGADVMVGFPGETDEDFQETCDLVRESPLTYTHVFKYSERAGTASAGILEKVEPKTAQKRSARLRRLSAAKKRRFCQAQLGRTIEVLFEHQENGCWTGYTGNYVRVAVRSKEDLQNEIRAVELQEAGRDVTYGELA